MEAGLAQPRRRLATTDHTKPYILQLSGIPIQLSARLSIVSSPLQVQVVPGFVPCINHGLDCHPPGLMPNEESEGCSSGSGTGILLVLEHLAGDTWCCD